ncbi:transmembrane protein, putative [Medicago truncatula]|nr:transmembrane protein, putative [Medicago truncatula]
MSFGVYVTGVLFQTAAFVSFLLIAHGYCIMCEHLSLNERRSTAALACVFYLTLVGYKASVPYFTVLLLLNYFISFYVIFHHISQNLLVLREQLGIIENEDVRAMHDAVYKKYIMFKKFQGAMQMVAMAETMIYMNIYDSSENYWLRLLIREWTQFCIFVYIGWIFRSQDLAPHFSVMPATKSKGVTLVPPIYSIEMDAATFKEFSSHEWHIGLPTSTRHDECSKNEVLVIIQHPSAQRPRKLDAISDSTNCFAVSNLNTNLSSCQTQQTQLPT